MVTLGRRRALGQHFLKDIQIAHTIAERALSEAHRHQCAALLEIGPGKGAITNPILESLLTHSQVKNFLLVERDQSFARKWQDDLKVRAPSVKVEMADFLEISDQQWLHSTPLAVVSNLPYSSGTAIATRLAAQFAHIPVMVLMFQAEVARRFRAAPSTKERGSLSVWIQNRWDVQKLLDVPPRSFIPAPQVDSEVIVLTRRNEPQIRMGSDPESEALWEKLLKTCFSQRRKMLRSVFPWRNALELSGVDGTKRAEALNWQEWDSLFQAVQNQKVDQSPRA